MPERRRTAFIGIVRVNHHDNNLYIQKVTQIPCASAAKINLEECY